MINFRQFCYNKWLEHKDEILAWTHSMPEYDSTYYFRKHRWMLKNMYKEYRKQLTDFQLEFKL